MSSTDPQEAIPSKDEIKTTPTSSTTEEKNLESTTGNSSKSDGLDAANASGDQQAPGNKVLPLIDSTEVNPPDDTDDNSTELLKDSVESSISADDSKKCLEDEETLLKSDDESGDQATESGSLNSKIDVQISSISKFCANQLNSQDLDSLSSELQDEEMILKWDDSDEVEEPNMEQETAILNEETDVEKITSTTVLQEPEATKEIDNVLVTDTVNEVTTTEVEGVTTDNNIVPKNQDDIIENMDIDTNMTVDNLIANLDKIIDEDVSDTTNVMEVDSTENLKTDLVEPNVSSSIIESKIDLESTRKEMEVDSTGIDTTTNVIKEIETVGTELTKETDIEMEVDTSANVEDSTKENLSHSEPNLLKVLPDIIIQKDLDISNMEIIENLPQVDMKVDEREPKTVENDNRNEPSDSLSLPVPEIKENIADCINEDAEKKTMGTDLNVSSGNDSLDLSVIEAREHGLNEPNMMIEIPTQEFIDFDESPDISQTDSDPGKDKKMLNEDIVETTVNINKDVTEMEESKSSDILLSDETGKENTENIVKESENKGTIIEGENVTKTIEIISDSKEVLPCKDSSTVPIKDVPISISSTAKDTQEAEVSSTEDAEKPSEIALLAKVDQHSVEKVEQPSQEVETLSKEVTILSEEVTPSKDLQHALPSELLVEQPEVESSTELQTLSDEVKILPKEVEPSKDVEQHDSKLVLPVEQPEAESSKEVELSKNTELIDKEVAQTPKEVVEQQASHLELPVEQPEVESSKTVEPSKNTLVIDKEVAQTPKEAEKSVPSQLELPVKQLEIESSKEVEPSKNAELIDKEVAQTPKEVEKSVSSPLELPVKQLEIESSKEVEPSKNTELIDKEVAQTPKEAEKSVPSQLELPVKQLEVESSKEVEPSNNAELIDKEVAQTPKEAEKSVPSQLELPVKQQEVESSKELKPSKNTELIDNEVAQTPKEAEKAVDTKLTESEILATPAPVSEVVEKSSEEAEPIKEVLSKEIDSVPENSSNEEDPSLIETATEPSTSFMTELVKQQSKDQTKDLGAHPSTSFMSQIPDTSDEVPDVTDSLGLLAESSRVMDDDEEQDNSDHDDGDYDEDFDPDDESSNQITAENSEDSNAPHSETDLPKEHTLEGRKEKDVESPNEGEFNFAISEVTSAVKCIEDKDIDLAEEVDITSDTNGEDEQMDQTEESMDVDISSAIEIEEKELKDDELEDDQADMDTVKLSDTTNNEDGDKIHGQSILKDMLCKKVEDQTKDEKLPESPSKTKKLEISKPKHVVNIVDLEESSSEDDIQEVEKDAEPEVTEDVTSVNISGQIEIMSSGGNTSDIVTKEGEIVISGVPKPKIPHKPARLNTSEVTIKTANKDSVLVIPEHQVNDQTTEKSKPKFSLEVFSLDSDEEDGSPAMELKPPEPVKLNNRCINIQCKSDSYVQFYKADPSMVAYYDGNKKKRPMVCQPCAEIVYLRGQDLLQGVKNFTPLLDLAMGKTCQELVEISDSDDEDDGESKGDVKETIGLSAALLMEEKLANMLNETWIKYNMDARLKETEDELNSEIKRLEDESKEINDMLNECQLSTDKLRNDLYATFQQEQQELSSIVIFDTPDNVYSCVEGITEPNESRILKRRLSSVTDIPPKRPAIPLGYAPLDSDSVQGQTPTQETIVPTPAVDPKLDDDKDISVVQLSAEAAPPGLPPPGEVRRPPLQAGAIVFAARNAASSWVRAKLLDYTHKDSAPNTPFSMCRVKFEMKNQKSSTKMVPARYVAYLDPCDVRLTIGTRIIALFKDTDMNSLKKRTSYYSGVVAEIPNPVNSYRYLVFFDDGYAQYVRHADVRLVCECSSLVWEEVQPFSREFVRQYLLAYPERPMVRLHTGQSLKTEWNGKWWISKVIQVDASLVHVHFEEDNRTEWIYRGSTRLAPLYLELQAAERHRARPLPRNRAQRTNMPYVEYTRSDEQAQKTPPEPLGTPAQQEEIRRQRSVAKKSTASTPVPQPHHSAHPPPAPPAPHPHPHPPASVEPVTSRVVYYTPKNAVKPYKMAAHTCSPKCKRSDVLALADLRTYNPLAKPLLSGWERQIVRYKGHKEVMYRAPCGRRLRNMRELHRYLRATRADMGVDLFDFGPNTHCLAEFVLNKCLVGKKDLSNGKENVPVPCVNYYDDTLPEFCSYNTERTPTAGVPLNLDPDFLCGCDCTDDCEDKSKCACWKMTLEGARTIGLKGNNVGYSYKRLPEPLPSGIYECNSRCKCKHTCLNRVAQHPLQLKLQVFKTPNRGWGIRALNDVPKGSFLCVYAGNLLTDATANLDGLNEGDEYLAELDYIEVVEQMKEGYEDDIPQADKKLDKKDGATQGTDDEEEEESSADEEAPSKNEKEDGDFEPGFLGGGFIAFRKQLRKRDRVTNEKEEAAKKEAPKEGGDDDCITISDDEEVREPSRFMAQAGMSANHFVSKYSSVRTLYGKDEACYIMDAKVQGNIGRYLNHSCCPNVFVQNVFVDTHDPRFPWVSFFAASHIRAGTELTWNYNYDIGSVPGKVLYCYCGATNCRGRLL